MRGRPPRFFSLTGGSEALEPSGAVSSNGKAMAAKYERATAHPLLPNLHMPPAHMSAVAGQLHGSVKIGGP